MHTLNLSGPETDQVFEVSINPPKAKAPAKDSPKSEPKPDTAKPAGKPAKKP